MNVAVKTASIILRNAAGEPPLGSEAAFFRDDQGEIFRHPVEAYRSGATDIGILELDNGEYLAKPPSFAVNRPRYPNRESALRAAIAHLIRRARKYMRNKDGDGTQWSEGFAGRVIEWALSMKETRQALVQATSADAEAPIDHPVSDVAASDDARVIEDSGRSESGSLNQTLPSDPIVRALCEAKRTRREYPAGHTFGMTNPIVNGSMVTLGTCTCGDSFSYPFGSAGHEKMDAAIEAHWQKFDASPDKVDGRGQPLLPEAPPAKPKKQRKRKEPDAPEGIPASIIAAADTGTPAALRSEPAPMSPGAGSSFEEAAPIGAASEVADGANMGLGPIPALGTAVTAVSEPPVYEPLSNAEKDPDREAGLGGGSLALTMAAEPADDWSPLLSAALDMAWREPPRITDVQRAVLDFSKVYAIGADVERPVLRWHGGKWRLAPWIISHFPEHRVYVEPFGGAASVLLRKRRSYAEVYNDLDREVISFFRILQDPRQSARLVELLYLTPFARDEFELGYKESDDPIERARRLVVRAFMGHGSDSMAGVVSGFRANSNKSGTTPAHDWANYITALPLAIDRMRGVVIEQREAVQVMTTHDAETTLHYVDPPYMPETRSWMISGKGKGNYRHELGPDDHASLLASLLDLKGMVVLSGYPCEMYDSALNGWRRVEIAAFADGARPRTEVLWLNPACADALDAAEPRLFDLATLDVANTPPLGCSGA